MAAGSARTKRIYTRLARWYDRFVAVWNRAAATPAENDLASFLQERLESNSTILELGCGTGRNLQTIYKLGLTFGKYRGIDSSRQMLAIARRRFDRDPRVRFDEGDITLVGCNENADIILCTWVLSHFGAPATLVNRWQECLGTGGEMFLSVFTRPEWRVAFWLIPVARLLLAARPVDETQLQRFQNVRTRRSYARNTVITMRIGPHT